MRWRGESHGPHLMFHILLAAVQRCSEGLSDMEISGRSKILRRKTIWKSESKIVTNALSGTELGCYTRHTQEQ